MSVEGIQNVQSYQPVVFSSNEGHSELPVAETPQGDPPADSPAPVSENAQASSVIQFSKDAVSGKMLLRVVDPDSGEVVRQIPPEEMVAISRMLGLLFDKVV